MWFWFQGQVSLRAVENMQGPTQCRNPGDRLTGSQLSVAQCAVLRSLIAGAKKKQKVVVVASHLAAFSPK
jgi:hypothetical protein